MEEKSESLYPIYFGVSCAFVALRLLTGFEKKDEKWVKLGDKMLQGSAQLLGLLVWRIQREEANTTKSQLLLKIEELKEMRHEDAKANEKVVGIFASQEQGWFIERKNLRRQIGSLINKLRVIERKKDEEIAELKKKLSEMEVSLESKDKMVDEMEQKIKELEELRKTANREAQERSTELWKHKTAFVEIVSNQRHLEAEIGRAFRQVEATKLELDAVLEQKQESVLLAHKMSIEMAKMQKDLEQKDKILSAMLRKSKLDIAEKQILLKEVKVLKAKKKQAELETERWRAVSESRHERHSLNAMFANHASTKLYDSSGVKHVSNSGKTRSQLNDVFKYDYSGSGLKTDTRVDDLVVTADVKRLETWVRAEAEKYAAVIEKRHHLELDAFAEQMSLKNEKLEVFRWRLLSMELDSKRLKSNVEGLNQDVSQLRQDNMKWEALQLDKEEELGSLKEQFAIASQVKPMACQKTKLSNLSMRDHALRHGSFWPKFKIIKKIATEKEKETRTALLDKSQEDITPAHESKNIGLIVQSPEKESEEENEYPKSVLPGQSLSKYTTWKMDLHALGVSYKIKRLKQQLLMLERLTGNQENGEDTEGSSNEMKGFLLLISSLNKQVSRYQSLQGKTDGICQRLHDNDLETNQGECSSAKTKGGNRTLEHLLEETLQLQRYMVAAGQKLMEIQSKIAASGLVGVDINNKTATTFNMKRFSDNIICLFQEVQRGLEIRIARIIGDVEGTLAVRE